MFKGGTCLRKCYYETFRFSEDLDFTIIDGGPEEPGDLMKVFGAIAELFGEKLRALAERCRPRDLYDVVHMYRHPDLIGLVGAVRSVLSEKCARAGIDVPTVEAIRSSPFRAEIESEWENMLGHQLPKPLPPFESFAL